MSRKTTPGFHPKFDTSNFGREEKEILSNVSKSWFLTRPGRDVSFSGAQYRYFLMKPTPDFMEMFNIEREIITVFSPYDNFQPRTLDVFGWAESELTDFRAESICRILISKDPDIEERVDSMLNSDPEQPIIIPFTYNELKGSSDGYLFMNKFRKYFYSRNLFDFKSPLKSDLYFFGRSHLIHEIVSRHKDGEHTGLFGLRKSGKTSIIYAIERTLGANGGNYISIDCESPSIHLLRWNELLEKVVKLYRDSINSKVKIDTDGRYEEKYAADSFEEDILKLYRSKKKQSTLFLFDEIERITPGTASSEHWDIGNDFVYFWQTLRGFYQRNPNVFTYMLVGTNPSCVENSMIVGHENPIYSSIPAQYVPTFDLETVRKMVGKLGSYMGLYFDDIVYSKLTEDFGGHPFLIRQACSLMHEDQKGERPQRVDKALYQKIKTRFTENSANYLDMIMEVLQQWYPDEYEMLKYLSQGANNEFEELAKGNPELTQHLIGYGLIQSSQNGYVVNIEVVREYLAEKYKYKRINLSDEEMVAEVSQRRNRIEKSLRKIFKNALKLNHGKARARDKMLQAIPQDRREKLQGFELDDLLASNDSPLYFSDLVNLVKKEWPEFENIFGIEKGKAVHMLQDVNDIGRPDAHAKTLNKVDFDQLRIHFERLEAVISEWD